MRPGPSPSLERLRAIPLAVLAPERFFFAWHGAEVERRVGLGLQEPRLREREGLSTEEAVQTVSRRAGPT